MIQNCPGCDGSSWVLLHDLGEWSYVRCPTCGLARLEPFPSAEESTSLYGDEYFSAAANAGYDDYVGDASVHRRNGRARMSRLGRPPQPGAPLVDVGCAFGYTMLEARASGWTPWGVDANATARASVVSDGMACAPSMGELGLSEGSVGAVTFFQSLEHLPDPAGALREAASLLRADGSILIETWDRSSRTARLAGGRWQQLSPPSVLWLFDRQSLGRLAESAGLRLDEWRWSTKWVTIGLVSGQVLGSGAARRLGPLRRTPLPYVLGDLVTVRLRPR